ncbi:F0F1 ATP synthase subunit gamma [Candidatus Pantoea edessiphila]|uniref:ATP synthase gamma chain n=1 Tax=Candidatus Pantoea edessiphila TaxID=2044610 RepID=A0A2P5SXD3_9GAMM|nr:F0F1 ATP synthase subunit gamma [Candidatus Pantoea edessiphila]MBK4775848.1 F0F1 ATP synthase subunit gamma [Pantoea sp. Edef]PPI86963.1 F0F1 ATP synthase subunit gamma [Candidatus Pantoea edessiphila]
MASIKQIRNKIESIKNTQKITKAMEMVAASKMRKTQERVLASRPYHDLIIQVINHITLGNLEYKHNYLIEREVKKVGYLLISTDRGLCSGLNINLFKKLLNHIKCFQEKNIEAVLAVLGSKGISFFNSISSDINVIAQISGIDDDFDFSELIGLVKVMLNAYDNENIDKLYIVSNQFQSTMIQSPKINQIIPLLPIKNENNTKSTWDYLYEPDSKTLLNNLLYRYIESQFYQAVLENLASEQAARMVAMKAATDNCCSLINELNLLYNKVRQASITQELIEIVSGASAV